MMVFDNKTIQYSISNQGEYYRIDDLVTIVNKDIIKDLYLTIYDLEDNYIGNFYYSENQEGKCFKDLNNVAKENFSAIDQFIDETLSELKLNIPK